MQPAESFAFLHAPSSLLYEISGNMQAPSLVRSIILNLKFRWTIERTWFDNERPSDPKENWRGLVGAKRAHNLL